MEDEQTTEKNYALIFSIKYELIFLLFDLERNNLSFIETSALDSTNVETAFQNILTGKSFCFQFILTWLYIVFFVTLPFNAVTCIFVLLFCRNSTSIYKNILV